MFKFYFFQCKHQTTHLTFGTIFVKINDEYVNYSNQQDSLDASPVINEDT